MQIASQADAIISKLQTINNQEKDAEPTIVIAADTVCSFFNYIYIYISGMISLFNNRRHQRLVSPSDIYGGYIGFFVFDSD